MAEEQGSKNEHISDAEKKMDALCDMIRDACMKMDEGSRRLDARMDSMEENFRKMDAERKDSEKEEKREDRKDAKKDSEEEEKEEKGEAKAVAADKRKDSEKEEKREDRKDAKKDSEEEEKEERKDRKDAKKDSEEEKREDRKDAKKDEDESAMDSHYITKAEAAALRVQIAALQARAPALISDADRERFALIQEQADPVFQAFGDRAPGPLDGETPTQYKRRLGGKLQAHSPKWKDARLSSIGDEAALDVVLADVYADSMAAARKGGEVPRGHLRAIERSSGGHTIIEYHGEPESWMNALAGHSQRGTGEWRRPN